MKDELAKYQGVGFPGDGKRKKELKDLEEKLSKTELRAEQFELDYQQSLKKVNQFKARIESIFILLECNLEENIELLGTSGVTESNMLVYLGIIEQKIQEMLYTYGKFKEEKVKRDRGIMDPNDPQIKSIESLYQVGPSQPMAHMAPRIEIPTSLEEQSDDDDMSQAANQKPMGIEEFRQKVEQDHKAGQAANTRKRGGKR